MRKVALAIDGRYGDPIAGLKTVVQVWKNLTAGWQYFKREKISDGVVRSTSNVSDSTLNLAPSSS